MATPLTYQKIQTLTGLVSIPIYNPADVPYSALRVMTSKGLGAYDLVPVSATLPLRIMTPEGIKAFNTVVGGSFSIVDSFNRPNSTTSLGTTETGQVWQSFGTNNVWGIQNNQAYPVTPVWDRPVYIDAGVSDNVAMQVTIGTFHAQMQIMWRATTNSANFFILQGNAISEVTNGSFANKGTISPPLANGDVFRVELFGEKHAIFVNGVEKFAFNSAGHMSGTKFGFTGHSVNGPLLRFDDFLIESYIAPESVIPNVPANNIVEDFLDNTYNFTFVQDVRPWNRYNTASLDGNLGHIKSSNQGVDNSESSITFTALVPANTTRSWIEVDYAVDSEPGYDYFYIYINGVEQLKRAGLNQIGVFSQDLPPGTHKLKFRFTKDGGAASGTDSAYVSGIRLNHTI